MARRKSAPAVLPPLRNCGFCKGTGWAQDVTGLQLSRVAGGTASYGQVRRCSCTDPQKRSQESAPEPAPAGLDGARKRSGEKEEA